MNRPAALQEPPSIHWHTLDPQQALAALGATPAGITQTEAERRLASGGPNRLRPPAHQSAVARLLSQFRNMLIYVLLASALVAAFLQHWVDTGVIVGVVVINAIIGFIQEGKAEKALDAIRRMLSLDATVLRDGKRKLVPAEELVPGDIVLLQSGDKVPADLRLINTKNLRIEEAALTGESEAVEKSVAAVAEHAVIGDRLCMTYSGTLVVYGQGAGMVVATGDRTEIGLISAMLEQVKEPVTPLLRRMETLGRQLTAAIVVLAAGTFGYGILAHGYATGEMFMAAVSVAVAAIPEGLPAIMTITLALGVQKMARRNAIIRRLPAVEALGSVTVICTDKTGTLTRNEMTAQRAISAECVFEVSGAGYAPHGGFSVGGKEVAAADRTEMLDLLRVGLLCNDALLRESGSEWKIEGDPTEGALIALAMKAGLDATFEHESLPRTDTIPFESAHRFMATLHHDHAGHAFIFVKGAPEQVLGMCASQRSFGEDRPLLIGYWHEKIAEAAALGQRLLAVAARPVAAAHRELGFADVETGFTLLGLVGISDPPRDEAIAAVQRCRAAGIRVKMITGDHAATACAIGAKLGIGDGSTAITGVELDRLNDGQLRGAVAGVDVFARASPEHKLRLVAALQANGEIVAMTGDGVNDAPALKCADIGVAMGMKGTEVAKEAAEMVLADDNFASIAHAVEEGRTVYDNIRKAIVFILPTNGGEAGIVVIAIIFGMTLPITPVQILWINMVTAVTLALALGFENAEADVMRRPPRAPREPVLSAFMMWRVAFVSALLVGGSVGLFLWEGARGASVEASRTVAVNALVMGEIFYLFNCRYLLASAWSREGLFGNRYVLAAVALLLVIQAIFTYLPFMQQMFGTVGIDAAAWVRIAAFGALLFAAVEIEKRLIQRSVAA
ncbi:MAG: ATPase P [Gallionellaceae bacterium]|nr:MAG: ATPase P [Gallionellaceae bacterium]